MSDISLNLSYDADSARRQRPPRGNRGRGKGFHNRTHASERRGPPHGPNPADHGHNPTHHGHNPTHHGHNPPACLNSCLRPRGSAGASTSSHKASPSAHQPPPCAANNGKPAGRKPAAAAAAAATAAAAAAATTHRPPSASSNHRPAVATAAATQTSPGIPTKYLALDCEMVGTGPKGSISQLARCSLVSYEGDVVYDKFINPSVPVTDYRTRWSGIRRCDLVNAMPYAEARKEILRLLMGKVVIGHAVHNDFKVLGYSHPAALTRDTSRIPLLNLRAGFAVAEVASLKRLTKAIFNRDIQTGRKGHSSVEDAKATMELYKVVEVEWEKKLASRPC
ncbi:interferon-stimulated 20 kDa exonuclease-like 2 [Clinocottus analis]|uniref:interferon-stimulated 20 kDa exonuclease-like 2 n=1 Tax=Clinocottus analis TaxID=304258 RepID=UPI0035C0B7C0